MSVYWPDVDVVGMLIVSLSVAVSAGFAILQIRRVHIARAAAWSLVTASLMLAATLCRSQPPGVRMVAIIALLLSALKAVVAVEWTDDHSDLTWRQWLGFALWPGMDVGVFAVRRASPLPGASRLIRMGVLRAVVGAVFVALARIVWIETASRRLGTVPLLVGLSLVLHFGVFNVVAGLWRAAGVDCNALFVAPLRAKSLREFWGRRWNLAFSEMTAAAVYRPLSPQLGRPLATFVAFLFSGLLHELAISVPVRAGYGLPFLYFALHGTLMVVERALARRGRGIDTMGWRGRMWTAFWLVVPMPLLFHRPFLDGVVWPLIGMQTD